MSVRDLYNASRIMGNYVAEIGEARRKLEEKSGNAGTVTVMCPKDGTPLTREPALDGGAGEAYQCQVCHGIHWRKRKNQRALKP